jgi:hypothetical protein
MGVKTVLGSLQKSVHHQESTYKMVLELHARRDAEAKSHYREKGEELERPVPPEEPPVRERYLPEILEFLVSSVALNDRGRVIDPTVSLSFSCHENPPSTLKPMLRF